jgi:hypothetical protein
MKQLTDVNKELETIYTGQVEKYMQAFDILKLLDLQRNLSDIEEKLAKLTYLGNEVPEKSLWNAYCLVFLHPSPEFEPERFDQVNKEVLESLRNRGYNSRIKVLEDLRSLNNQVSDHVQNQMAQEPLGGSNLDQKLTRVESTLGRMSLIVSQVDTDAIPEL